MPPPRRSSPTNNDKDTSFGRAHPNVQKALIMACQASSPLLVATVLWGAGVMRRPMWERALMWRAAWLSFVSRWILVGCAITWAWNEWGDDDAAEVPAQHAAGRN